VAIVEIIDFDQLNFFCFFNGGVVQFFRHPSVSHYSVIRSKEGFKIEVRNEVWNF